MYDLDPKVKVIGKKAGICDGVPSTAALVLNCFFDFSTIMRIHISCESSPVEKRIHILCESSPLEMIHMKCEF